MMQNNNKETDTKNNISDEQIALLKREAEISRKEMMQLIQKMTTFTKEDLAIRIY